MTAALFAKAQNKQDPVARGSHIEILENNKQSFEAVCLS